MAPILCTLKPHFFTEKETCLLEFGGLSATAFRFGSGVCGLRLENEVGQLVLLPFQGQQVWSAQFDGRELTMQSMFKEPVATRVFEANYGGFLIHCGATAMGDPTPADTHPLHGELPNAPYQNAFIVAGEDEGGQYIGLGGQYQHTIAFACNYFAEPLVKLYSGSRLLSVSMRITNLKNSPMELMYLAHINFRPVNYSRLVYSAQPTPAHVRTRIEVPGIQVPPGYPDFIRDLAAHPEKHHILTPELQFDPEVVFFIDSLVDEGGFAHALQILPDGQADYVRYRPSELNKCVRWISRTPDQNALGLSLPATAESEGYLTEKTKGNLKILPPKASFQCAFKAGALRPEEVARVEQLIEHILSSN